MFKKFLNKLFSKKYNHDSKELIDKVNFDEIKEDTVMPHKNKIIFVGSSFAILLVSLIVIPVTIKYVTRPNDQHESNEQPLSSNEVLIAPRLLNEVDKPFNITGNIDNRYLSSLYDFSSDVLERLYDSNNIIFSPISIAFAMSMLYEGLNGVAKEELNTLLHYDTSFDVKTMIQQVLLECARDKTDYYGDKSSFLDVNQAAFIADYYIEALKQEYLDILSSYYYAEFYGGSFLYDEMYQKIADWINQKTNNMFDVKPDGFNKNPNIVMMLINAIYLNTGWWTKPRDGFEKKFTNIDGTITDTEFLKFYYKENYSCYSSSNFQLFSLFLNDGFCFNVLLPNENEEEILSNPQYYQYLYNIDAREELTTDRYTDATIYLPIYKENAKYDLVSIFKEMGVNAIFGGANADFSNMVNNDDNLNVSSIIHEAGIDVNKRGVEAAAYTIIIIEAEEAYIPEYPKHLEIEVNRPFLYSITYHGIPLFVGAKTSI